MSYQVLARKWRPRTFEQVVGQPHVVQALTNGLDEGRIHHAFLFTGTRGVGKTTIARILAKSLNCLEGISATPCGECEHCAAIDEGRFVDLLEIDAASRTKVDDTREILDNVPYAPARGRFKVYLVDEVHMLSTHSFNALLKTLEEPPEHVKFVLATTDPQKIPVTILSRCLQFNLRRLTVDEIAGQLGQILAAEEIEFEPPALDQLARAADGSMRDALSLLDQALASGSGQLSTAGVEDMLGSVEQRHLHQLIEALAERDAASAMAVVDEVFSLARDLGQLLLDLAETLHRVGLIQQLPDYRDDSRNDWDQLLDYAGRLDSEDVQLYYQIAISGRRDLALAPSARTGCQMSLLRMFAFTPAESGAAGGSRAPAAESGSAEAPSRSRREPAAGHAASVGAGTAADSAGSESELAGLESPGSWAELLSSLRLNGSVRAVAGVLALDSVSGRRMVFRISEDERHLVTERFRASLKKSLDRHFGCEVAVDIRTGKVEQDHTPAGKTRAALDQAQLDAEAAIEADPLVARFRETFGAEIVPGSVRPIDTSNH